MLEAQYRAMALIREKPGFETELLEFTKTVVPKIRAVPGLQKFEFSQSVTEPSLLVLYYWWENSQDSVNYSASSLFAEILAKLTMLIAEHTLIVSKIVES